jgi:predicted small lipoprotein YifL
MLRLSVILLATLVAACGNRGPLVLPPGPPPPPLIDKLLTSPAKPAATSQPAAAEGNPSTDGQPATR